MSFGLSVGEVFSVISIWYTTANPIKDAKCSLDDSKRALESFEFYRDTLRAQEELRGFARDLQSLAADLNSISDSLGAVQLFPDSNQGGSPLLVIEMMAEMAEPFSSVKGKALDQLGTILFAYGEVFEDMTFLPVHTCTCQTTRKPQLPVPQQHATVHTSNGQLKTISKYGSWSGLRESKKIDKFNALVMICASSEFLLESYRLLAESMIHPIWGLVLEPTLRFSTWSPALSYASYIARWYTMIFLLSMSTLAQNSFIDPYLKSHSQKNSWTIKNDVEMSMKGKQSKIDKLWLHLLGVGGYIAMVLLLTRNYRYRHMYGMELVMTIGWTIQSLENTLNSDRDDFLQMGKMNSTHNCVSLALPRFSFRVSFASEAEVYEILYARRFVRRWSGLRAGKFYRTNSLDKDFISPLERASRDDNHTRGVPQTSSTRTSRDALRNEQHLPMTASVTVNSSPLPATSSSYSLTKLLPSIIRPFQLILGGALPRVLNSLSSIKMI